MSESSPYGIGTHDVELFGSNERFGYRLASRKPSEPLRITDDPNKPDVEDGVRYIRPREPVEFELVFEKVTEAEAEEGESTAEGESSDANAITIIGHKFVVAPVTTPLERSLMGNLGPARDDVTACLLVNSIPFAPGAPIDPQGEEWQELAARLKAAEAKPNEGLHVRLFDSMRDDVEFESRRARDSRLANVILDLGKEAGFAKVHFTNLYSSSRPNWRNTIEEAERKVKEDGTGGLPLVDTEKVKVTLVTTFLAHMLVDADCVVDWLPVVRDADGARLMADVLPAVAEAVEKARTGGGENLLIRLRYSATAKEELEKWANDIPGRKAYARGMGFELCNVSQSHISMEEEEAVQKESGVATTAGDVDPIAPLEELVQSYEQIHDSIQMLHKAKARGGSREKLSSSLLALLTAKAELETAKGNFAAAINNYKAAVDAAGENVAAHQQAYEVGTITLDGVLEANRKRAEAKLALSRARKVLADGNSGPGEDQP